METITICGRLGQDGKLESVNGKPVLKLNVAADSKKKGEKITRWYSCNYWGGAAEAISSWTKKGREVVISGRFSTREYTGKDGQQKTSLEIDCNEVKLVGRSDESGQHDRGERVFGQEQRSSTRQPSRQPEPDTFDASECPF